jgi:hypothetical protein
MELLSIMLNVIGPIFLIVGIAFFISRRYNPDPRSISVYLIYLFTPSLVFRSIYQSELTGAEIGGIAVVVIGVALTMTLVGTVAARLLRYEIRAESALILSATLVNAGNYGIPLNTFAFGEEAGSIAVVYYVVSSLIGGVLGVFFASRGTSSIKGAILNIFRVPILYAAVAGLIVNLLDIPLPLLLQRSIIEIAGYASIPMMLALLGLQLARVFTQGGEAGQDQEPTLAHDFRAVLLAAGLRLLVAPCVALVLALLIGISGLAFKVVIVQSSMPTAVLASALATQFSSDARYVSAVTMVATLASILTLSTLILMLGGTIG